MRSSRTGSSGMRTAPVVSQTSGRPSPEGNSGMIARESLDGKRTLHIKWVKAREECVHDLAELPENGGMRKTYASDISREKFEEILPLLQSVRKRTKPTTVDLYEVFCAVLYLLRTGCQWSMLPREFPQMAHGAFVLCQMERARPGRYQRFGAGFKKIRLARPERNWGAATADAIDRGRAERQEHGYSR